MFDKHLKNKVKKSFRLQQDESDCGVAALSSVIRFLDGYIPTENLRTLSGTSVTGSTMLGLLQAGESVGLDTQAYRATINQLKASSFPCLLHVTKYGVMEHFIVCYSYSNGLFLIGDPAEGIVEISESELDSIWISKALLTFSKTSNFIAIKHLNNRKYAWIKNAIKADKGLILTTILLGIVITSLSFATAIFTEKLIDNLLPSRDGMLIIIALCSWFILLIINMGFDYSRKSILLKQTFKLNVRLTNSFIASLLQKPKFFFDSRKKGDFIARLFDIGGIQSSVAVIIGNDLIKLMTLLFAIIIMAFYHLHIGVFLLLLIPVYLAIMYSYNSKLQKANIAVMSEYARNEGNYIDTLTGIEAIIQRSKQSSEASLLNLNFTRFQKSLKEIGLIEMKFKIHTGLLGILSVFLVTIFCIHKVLIQELEIGDMVAILSILGIALNSANQIALSLTHIQEAHVALDRTYDIISTPSESTGQISINNMQTISFKKVSFRFNGHEELFGELEFTVQIGQILCILGDNGSGKSTTLQLIQGFLEPNEGSILINNTDIGEFNIQSVRRLLGVVPQETKIFNESLAYNITLDHNISIEQVHSYCQNLGLQTFVESFHMGLETILGEDGVKASGGQKQLISLLRALYSEPDFLLLDEFTSSMDKNTKQMAIEILQSLGDRVGIILITHEEQFIKNATLKVDLNNFASSTNVT